MDLSFIDKLLTLLKLPVSSFLMIEILLIFIITFIFLVYNEKRKNKKVKITIVSLIIFFTSLLIFYFSEDMLTVLTEIIRNIMRCFYFPNIIFYIITVIISLIILIYYIISNCKYFVNKISILKKHAAKIDFSYYKLILIKFCYYATCNSIPVFKISSIMPFGYDDEAAYISAPVKRQPDDSAWCWAACMACIVQIETGDFYNCVTMGRRYTSDYNYRATISTVNNWLNNDFGLDYSIERDGSYLTSILNTLAHGHAVFGGFTGMTGHASIIRGIDFGSKTFSVMDPQDAVTDYLTGQIVNSYGNYGTMTYVQFVTSETLILGEYLYVNA